MEDKPRRKTFVFLVSSLTACRCYFAELGQILGVRVWCYCDSSTIPQWRGDLRLAMTVIKVERGGERGKGGRANEAKLVFVMNH